MATGAHFSVLNVADSSHDLSCYPSLSICSASCKWLADIYLGVKLGEESNWLHYQHAIQSSDEYDKLRRILDCERRRDQRQGSEFFLGKWIS